MLGFLVVGVNLSAQLLRVLLKDLLFLLLNVALLLLNLLLLLDDAEELVSLLFGLFGKASFALEELALASFLHILEYLLFVFQVLTFLLASCTLALLKGSLRT